MIVASCVSFRWLLCDVCCLLFVGCGVGAHCLVLVA